jgi:parvulin-like peptidyl-prolyl isomerase
MAKSSKKRQGKADKRSRRGDESSQAAKQTKKQIALSRKHTRQNRIIWLSVGALALVIFGIMAVGLIQELIVKPGRSVAIVNGSKIRTDDYQSVLTYRRYNLHNSIRNLQSELQAMDPSQEGNEFLINFYQQQLDQLQSSLALISASALDELIDDELIQQKAKELKLTVTSEEVEQAINEDLRQAMAVPPQEPVTSSLELPTPTPIPQEQVDEFYKAVINTIGLTEKGFHSITERSLLRTRVQDVLAGQVSTTGLVVHVQMIQADSEEEALAARQRIESGEDFAAVAQEVSTDPQTADTGGDMGWVTTGQLSSRYGEDLESMVFSLPVGEVGQVQSGEKVFVVQVLARDENGPLPYEVLTLQQNSALQDWLAERKESPETQIERLLEPDQIPPDPFGELEGS